MPPGYSRGLRARLARRQRRALYPDDGKPPREQRPYGRRIGPYRPTRAEKKAERDLAIADLEIYYHRHLKAWQKAARVNISTRQYARDLARLREAGYL
jgi:hypothetical protein